MIPAEELEAMRASIATSFDTEAVIVRHTTGAVDEYGNPAETWTPDATPVPCTLFRESELEAGGDQDIESSRWGCRFEHSVEITAQDRVEVDALTYEIDGPPERTRTHVFVHLVYTAGV